VDILDNISEDHLDVKLAVVLEKFPDDCPSLPRSHESLKMTFEITFFVCKQTSRFLRMKIADSLNTARQCSNLKSRLPYDKVLSDDLIVINKIRKMICSDW
jgi:hypothetical protein